jgi:hypothetical protein
MLRCDIVTVEAIIKRWNGAGGSLIKRVEAGMTDDDYARKLNELDDLLNNPDVSWDPVQVWSLLEEVSRHRKRHDTVVLTPEADEQP